MDHLDSYRSWWGPLPVWLKLVTALGIYPAWFFTVYCLVTGASKSRQALLAFGVCMIGTLLHITFDRRKRSGNHQPSDFDNFSGE